MRESLFLLFLMFVNIAGYSQSRIKEINPLLGEIPAVSENDQRQIERRDVLLQKEKLTAAEQQELNNIGEKFDETKESIWDVMGGGCSWYCGGGPYKIIASSFLPKNGSTEYTPDNAHDLSFKTAWVEGAKGNGIGEYIEYYFKNESPRITEIKIYDGYVKTDKAWNENSRVKKFELSINGVSYAILNLKDTKAEQRFKVPAIGHRSDKKDLILKFKILDVYPGTKYEDVAVTEIYFDGLDVHCLGKGTRVLLPHNRTKVIENLNTGDTVMTYGYKDPGLSEAIIEKLEKVKHKNLVKYLFENGTSIIATQDHPFLVDGKGWSSLLPDNSAQYAGYKNVGKVNEGDFFEMIDAKGKLSKVKLQHIEYLDQEQETYTISKLRFGLNFIANGMIVGVED